MLKTIWPIIIFYVSKRNTFFTTNSIDLSNYRKKKNLLYSLIDQFDYDNKKNTQCIKPITYYELYLLQSRSSVVVESLSRKMSISQRYNNIVLQFIFNSEIWFDKRCDLCLYFTKSDLFD